MFLTDQRPSVGTIHSSVVTAQTQKISFRYWSVKRKEHTHAALPTALLAGEHTLWFSLGCGCRLTSFPCSLRTGFRSGRRCLGFQPQSSDLFHRADFWDTKHQNFVHLHKSSVQTQNSCSSTYYTCKGSHCSPVLFVLPCFNTLGQYMT